MPGWRILLWVALMGVILLFLWMVRGILLPFVIAFVVSVLLEPTVRRLRRKGWPRPVAVGAIFGTFVLSVIAVSIWFIPAVTGQINGLRLKVEDVTASFARMDDSANFFVRWNPTVQTRDVANDPIDKILESNQATLEKFNIPSSKTAILNQYVEPQRAQISQTIQGFVKNFFGLATSFLVQGFMLLFVLIIAPMMLMNMDRIKQRGAMWIPPSIRESAVSMINDIGEVFTNYLRGVTFSVIGYMTMMAIVLSLLGAPYGILLGVLFGAIYLIPYLCVIISASTLLIVTGLSGATGDMFFHASNSWTFAAFVLAIFMVCHYSFDTLVYPRVVGSAVGLDPIVSIFVSFAGGALFGIVGMIIAYPFAGAVKIVLDRLIRVTSSGADNLRLPNVPLRHRGTTQG